MPSALTEGVSSAIAVPLREKEEEKKTHAMSLSFCCF